MSDDERRIQREHQMTAEALAYTLSLDEASPEPPLKARRREAGVAAMAMLETAHPGLAEYAAAARAAAHVDAVEQVLKEAGAPRRIQSQAQQAAGDAAYPLSAAWEAVKAEGTGTRKVIETYMTLAAIAGED